MIISLSGLHSSVKRWIRGRESAGGMNRVSFCCVRRKCFESSVR